MTEPVYSEQEVRRWLEWLARGMQKHGQSVFLMERLQPDWLPNSRQRWAYLLLTRLLQSGVVILVSLPLWAQGAEGLGFGVPAYGTVCTLLAGLSAALGEGLLRHHRRSVASLRVFVLWMIAANWLSLLFLYLPPILLGIRAGRGFGNEIQSTESLTWSWPGFRDGLTFRKIRAGVDWSRDSPEPPAGFGLSVAYLCVLAHGLLVSLMLIWFVATFDDSSADTIKLVILGISLLPNLLSAILTGISRRPVEMKIAPNEGMRRSLFASLSFVILGAIIATTFRFVATMDEDFWILLVAAWLIAVFGIYAGAWFGGMDVIAHYTLRMMLYANGNAPLNYAKFLDYTATELGFLQKVGGGYMFMHRYLLEYFAGGGDDVVSEVRVAGVEQPVS